MALISIDCYTGCGKGSGTLGHDVFSKAEKTGCMDIPKLQKIYKKISSQFNG